MSRPYGGISPEARAAERRTRLVAAGVELLGTGGVATMTMRAVCREAGLSQKFFYESFEDTDALLREVYRTVFTQTQDQIVEAAEAVTGRPAQVRAGVDAAARLVVADPRICRILLVEPIADLSLRRFVRGSIMALLEPDPVRYRDAGPRAKMRYATVFGAIISLFLEWTEGNLGTDRAAFTEHVSGLLISGTQDDFGSSFLPSDVDRSQ